MAPSKEMKLRSSDAALQLVNPDQTLKASKALLAHMKKASVEKAANADKKNLLADDETALNEQPVWLTLTTKRHIVDSNRLKPGKIVLPHPLNTDPEVSVCLISADPQRHYKNLIASEEFPDEWRTRITRVIDVGKLSSKFKQYEEQRKLYAEHDIFLGDSRIITRLPKALGKTFYKSTAKRPIPVNLESRNKPKTDGKKVKKAKGDEVNSCTPTELAAEVEKAVGAALVHLSPSTNTAIRIGYAGWKPEEIAANAKAVAEVLIEKYVPQKDKNVRSIYIKGPETTALPLYMADELWLDGEKDIVTNDSEEAKALTGEKPNIGKKRKSLEAPAEETAPATKKAKKGKSKALPESDDAHLDKEIAERKAKLKKQKAAAKKAVDV
ncbi:putative Ribosomal protein L1p/L10e family-domain-containing protein [Seiridium cardinale]